MFFPLLQASQGFADFAVHAQNLLDARVVFAFETLNLGEPVFELFQGLGIEVDTLGVAAKLRGGFLQLRQG